jgi:hypothetical protein
MACMCGDPYCGSCGPAQGNHKCICGLWTMDGGCHTLEACAEAIRKENEGWDEYYREMNEHEKAFKAAGREHTGNE